MFGDMAIYTTCKNNTFNGMSLPDIWLRVVTILCSSLQSLVIWILRKDLEVVNNGFLFFMSRAYHRIKYVKTEYVRYKKEYVNIPPQGLWKTARFGIIE